MNLVYDTLDSEYIFILFTLLKLTCLISVLNHVIACIWYATGRMSMERQELNWLENTAINASYPRVIDGNALYQYTTSLHWSLTQFTPASMDSFEKKIYEPTRTRLFSFLEYEVEKRRQDVKAEDVKLLPLLSEPLENLLSYEVNKGPIKVVARREVMGDEEKKTKLAKQEGKLQKCKAKFDEEQEQLEFDRILAAETQRAFENAHKTFKAAHPNVHAPDMIGPLGPGAWLAESAIWTNDWWYRGKLQASSTSGRF
ncbi:hypothetical protein AK812_SmicGene438 [Symbiodinium microadriaticum]|uniref:Uncharacterized protein n=1 Tax=Symbiodinium microadriaticum TaxID=2951 RepID=A0A1Q9F6L3_SYMMI|nr:hypothetical protein AK812_SmicGene438 [Symbiodinium microadriaticum]